MISFCIAAYNEEKNIGILLDKIRGESLIDEIIVVASGCTDKTVEICKSYPNVKTLVQEKREGKASAINLLLQESKGDIVILESADTIPCGLAISKLVEPLLKDPDIGAVGGRPLPLNGHNNPVTEISYLIWSLHHLVSLREPKLGEAIAFRNCFKKIPHTTIVDEASIELAVKAQGYKTYYEESAFFFNRGPETYKDLISQRKRVYLGHLILKKDLGFEVPTMKSFKLFKLLLSKGFLTHNGYLTVKAILIEAYCRLLAKLEHRTTKINNPAWEISTTTKGRVDIC